MTQLGEGVAPGTVTTPPEKPGNLIILVRERTSREPVENINVQVSGAASGSGSTDKNGEFKFESKPTGAYQITLDQEQFEMQPNKSSASIDSGETTTIVVSVARVLTTVTLKRIHIQGLVPALWGDKSGLEYGHWWVVVDKAESYGWWPADAVSLGGTLAGVPGVLNTMRGTPGTATRDPHHRDPGDEEFNPRITSGKSAEAIKAAIRAFAAGFSTAYGTTWRWPLKHNCQSFQDEMMRVVGMSKSGSKKLK